VKEKRSVLVAALAFLQRAFSRSMGLYRPPRFGEETEGRARQFHRQLQENASSLSFRLALEYLRQEEDLLSEEAALGPEALGLQRNLLELADRSEIADQLVTRMLTLPPVVKLFTALLSQAIKEDAAAIQIEFDTSQELIPVRMRQHDTWVDTVRIPIELARPLRGVIARIDGIGYDKLASRVGNTTPLPTKVKISWPNEHTVELIVES
jgi:type II secretory ATPase GspE/PulE/Tfp pilus assembly ATPase PilB-like protein